MGEGSSCAVEGVLVVWILVLFCLLVQFVSTCAKRFAFISDVLNVGCVVDSRFAEKTGLKVTGAWPTTSCSHKKNTCG